MVFSSVLFVYTQNGIHLNIPDINFNARERTENREGGAKA